MLNNLRQKYPNANVHASTFDDFSRAAQPVMKQLPVVTSEIGDTWSVRMLRLYCTGMFLYGPHPYFYDDMCHVPCALCDVRCALGLKGQRMRNVVCLCV